MGESRVEESGQWPSEKGPTTAEVQQPKANCVVKKESNNTQQFKPFEDDHIQHEERFESLYIINCKLQVQDEALYRLDYTILRKYKLQSQ